MTIQLNGRRRRPIYSYLSSSAFIGGLILFFTLCALALNAPAWADSTNLGCVDVPSNPTQGEVAVNTAFDCFDEAANDTVTLTVTGNTTVTSTEFNRNFELRLSGTPAGGFNLTVPTNKRFFLVRNGTGQTATVKYATGATVNVLDGQRRLLYGDGTDILAAAPDYAVSGSGGGGGAGGPAVFKGAQVKRTTTQSITTATPTAVAWDAEDYDTDALHDNATNNTRLSIPTGTGITKAIIGACVEWADNSTGDRTILILKNGAAVQGAAKHLRAADNESWECVYSAPLAVTAGTDYFEVQVTQSSGGNLNIVNGNYTWAAAWAVQYTSFRGALARNTANQSITTGTNTALAFNSETDGYDTDTIHDIVTNNSRFTVPTGVTKVRLTCGVEWGGSSAGVRYLVPFKNGATFNYSSWSAMDVDSSFGHAQNITTAVLPTTAGDYFECAVQQTSGGNLNVLTAIATFGALEIVE